MNELLTFEDALAIIDQLGMTLADPGLLASAIGRPAATVFGQDAYPDLATKVAALLDSVLGNHALVDGNKRTGWTLAMTTIWINGFDLEYDEDDAFTMVVAVAARELTVAQIADWFTARMRPPS